MRNKVYLSVLVISFLTVFLALTIIKSGVATPLAPKNTQLAMKLLTGIPNLNSTIFSASPEVVTSVLWDQRGIDTFYETTVLFMAIVGVLYVFSAVREYRPTKSDKESTVIMRVIAKLITPLIIVVAASVTIHGHLTPGGGFQGGAIFVIGPLIIILTLGSSKLVELGLSKERLLLVRSLALIGIALLGISLVLVGFLKGYLGYIFMNLPKTYLEIGFPYLIYLPWGIFLFSGTLLFFNILEFLAVSAGFTLALTVLESFVEGEGNDH